MTSPEFIQKWQIVYSHHQDYVYKNIFLRIFFDLGHTYIAARSKNKKGVVLDIGAGTGYHLKFQNVEKYKKYICLDSNKGMLEKIQNKKVEKILASCETIPLENESVDLIIASHVLEHIHNLDKAMAEMNRVTKKDGVILIVLPCDPGFLWKTLTKFSPSRLLLKKAGFDYGNVMKHEHVNSFLKCKEAVRKYFYTDEEVYYPFRVKNYNYNLLYCLRLLKKE